MFRDIPEGGYKGLFFKFINKLFINGTMQTFSSVSEKYENTYAKFIFVLFSFTKYKP